MTRIVADISVFLDGFVTGASTGPDNRLGAGGEVLHTGAFSDEPGDRRLLGEGIARLGVGEVGKAAFVVVMGSPTSTGRSSPPVCPTLSPPRERVEAAVSDSGRDLDVVLMGGGATVGSALAAGLVARVRRLPVI